MIIKSQSGCLLAIIGVGCELTAYYDEVYCAFPCDRESVRLGTYASHDEALRTIDEIYLSYGKVNKLEMPESGWTGVKSITFNGRLRSVDEITLEDLDLSIRTYNMLQRANLNTLGDLMNLSEKDLLKVRNLGVKGAEEIINKLATMGIALMD